MTSGERIRYFRKEISHMTQVEFAEKLNISRANVANIEKGRISLTERMLSAICNAFSLSEEWILTGKGEMHQETETTLFNAFAKQYNLTPAEQRVARYLLQLTSEDRKQLIKHIIGLAKAVDEPSKTTAAVPSPEALPYSKVSLRPPANLKRNMTLIYLTWISAEDIAVAWKAVPNIRIIFRRFPMFFAANLIPLRQCLLLNPVFRLSPNVLLSYHPYTMFVISGTSDIS